MGQALLGIGAGAAGAFGPAYDAARKNRQQSQLGDIDIQSARENAAAIAGLGNLSGLQGVGGGGQPGMQGPPGMPPPQPPMPQPGGAAMGRGSSVFPSPGQQVFPGQNPMPGQPPRPMQASFPGASPPMSPNMAAQAPGGPPMPQMSAQAGMPQMAAMAPGGQPRPLMPFPGQQAPSAGLSPAQAPGGGSPSSSPPPGGLRGREQLDPTMQGRGGMPQANTVRWDQAMQMIKNAPGNQGMTPSVLMRATDMFMQKFGNHQNLMEWREQQVQYKQQQLDNMMTRFQMGLFSKEEMEKMREEFQEKMFGKKGEQASGLLTQKGEQASALEEQKQGNRVELAKLRAKGNAFAQLGPDGKYEMTTEDRNKADAIAHYWDDPGPLTRSAYSARGGGNIQAQAILAAASNIAKKEGYQWDNNGYKARQAGEIKFTSGPQADKIRSIGVAQSHLHTFVKLTDALNNNNLQVINSIVNAWNKQSGSPKITKPEAAAQIIAGELVKAIVNSGGGVRDRAEMETHLDPAKMTAEQVRENAQTLEDLLEGQIQGWRRQYESFEKKTGKTFDEEFGIKKESYTGKEKGETKGADETKGAVPEVGAVVKGYRFKGGDPSKKENWEKE